jgi:hypothetical protein
LQRARMRLRAAGLPFGLAPRCHGRHPQDPGSLEAPNAGCAMICCHLGNLPLLRRRFCPHLVSASSISTETRRGCRNCGRFSMPRTRISPYADKAAVRLSAGRAVQGQRYIFARIAWVDCRDMSRERKESCT